jgi:hypothetical protein
MIVRVFIDGECFCAPYDDCIDIVLAARERGADVSVEQISLETFEQWKLAREVFENPPQLGDGEAFA